VLTLRLDCSCVHGYVCGPIHAVTVAPTINVASASFASSPSPVQGVLGVGAQVTFTVDITDATSEPTATVFGGDPIAASGSGSSYTFSYTIQAGDQGPIVFSVAAENFAGLAVQEFSYPGVSASAYTCQIGLINGLHSVCAYTAP